MRNTRENSRRYREKHRKELSEKSKEWARKNREHCNARNNAWRLAHPEIIKLSSKKAYHKMVYGEPYENKLERLKQQDFRCANPGCRTVDPGGHGWNTDHNHETNQIRGELCNGCNLALGILNEDLARIQGLADYLKKYMN
jgi:hypothetical protein